MSRQHKKFPTPASSNKHPGLVTHVLLFIAVIGLLHNINLMTYQGVYWVVWPAMWWGGALIIRLVSEAREWCYSFAVRH